MGIDREDIVDDNQNKGAYLSYLSMVLVNAEQLPPDGV